MVIWLQNVTLSVVHLYSPQLRTRAYLYECLSSWMKHVAEDKLQVYVDSLAVQQFEPNTRAQRLPLCLSILCGLSKAMAVPNPPQNCWTALCSATEKIYNLLPDNIPVCPGSYLKVVTHQAKGQLSGTRRSRRDNSVSCRRC